MSLSWHLLLGPLLFLIATCEEPSTEGLSSTSLLDISSLLSSPHQDAPLDSDSHGQDQQPDILQGLLSASQGSGFSSQETEESSILQSPQYVWDEEIKKVNGSSEGYGEIRTDYPVPSSSHDSWHEGSSNISSPSIENQETSTLWLSTELTETTKQVSSSTNGLAGKEVTQPITPNEREAGSLAYKEKTVFKTKSANHTHSMAKSHKKTKTHLVPKNHHINQDPVSEHSPGPPAGSQGLPAGESPAGHKDEKDEGWIMPSSDPGQDEEKTEFPKQSSTLQDGGIVHTAVPTEVPWGSAQVICKDWINLAGKNYVILNMSDDIDCEQFRWQRGPRLVSLLEGALPWKTKIPQRDWVISLTKPNENDNHLLMTITEEQHVVPIKDVFSALADIKRSLAEIGIEGYSSTVSCHLRPNQPRSDYGKLFIVLVIIGSMCVMIIVAGIIYICWQRRLPKLKNMELHFVENGCHDNPTLDVVMDGQSEMQEKKPSLNGGTSHQADGWETLINKGEKEEADAMEEDTHL
ncbi:podocalyxin-like protein 2 [Rhinophrynus dorsalis]